MRNILLSCLAALLSLYVNGQVVCERLFVVSTYNFGESIQTGVTPLDPKDAIRFVVGQVCDDDSYEVVPATTFGEGAGPLAGTSKMLLFVHGNNVSFSDIFNSIRQMADLYNVPSFYFAWPAKEFNHKMVKNYYASKRNIEESFPQFLQTVDSLSLFARDNGIECSVVFHSLGNEFAQLYAGYLAEDPSRVTPFTNVILSAACVPETGHAEWVDVLAGKIANKVYIIRNGKDLTLRSARLFLEGKPLLGESAHKKAESADAIYVDVKNILKPTPWRHDHSYYAGEAPIHIEELRQLFETAFSGGSPEKALSPILTPLASDTSSYSLKKRTR